ncbi:MAG TPA: DoxX family protein [Nitrospirales bacterium]|jgi:putative oxidoreductase
MLEANSSYAKYFPALLSILRIVTALLFMQHGLQKILGMPLPPPNGMPPLLSLLGIAGLLELFGGGLMLVGLFTRPVAFILSGEMAVAYFMAHAPQGFWPVLNKGELAVLYCFIFLFFWAAGGGPWSLDQLWQRQESSSRLMKAA